MKTAPAAGPATGLSQAEADARLAERGPLPATTSSRSYRSIVVANVFTVFNLILVAFGAVTLVFGDPRDALFLGIVVANAGIGIFQEARAKRALDRLAALIAPTATVVRDGEPRSVPVDDVVVGDLVRLRAGDQIVADGRLAEASGVAVDEAHLTGESESQVKDTGSPVWSGSFAVEGEGAYVAQAVGEDSRAAQLTRTARAFRHPRSPLELAMNKLLIAMVVCMVPLAVALLVSLSQRDLSTADTVQTATAALVNLVPEGLILLVSLTAAVSAANAARRGVLAQQLNAIESLASVDILCTDKTGTLTEASLRVVEVRPAAGVGEPELDRTLARYAAAAPARNATLEAVHAAGLAGDLPAEEPTAQVPFSSRRRWSALELGGDRLLFGAPEVLLHPGDPLLAVATGHAETGRRVLAVANTTSPLPRAAADAPVPAERTPLGIVVLAERLRPDADATVAFFGDESVALKVLSGDAPATVGAIARDVGIAAPGSAPALDGGALPEDDEELRDAVLAAPAIGRISPEDKARVVRVLRDGGHYVGMLGDGVNDVPALKGARLAIAQGSGTQMARSVADLVLVQGEFSEVPRMVHAGRQILRNIQRVSRLFVTKAVFASLLLMAVAIPTGVFPLLPRQFTLTSSVAVGIPAFFLALAPSSGPWRPTDFLRNVATFSIPAGLAVGSGVLIAYVLSRDALGLSLAEARTVATAVVATGGLGVVFVLEDAPGTRRGAVLGLCGLMAAGYVLVQATAAGRDFFALEPMTATMLAAWAVGGAIALGLVAVVPRYVEQALAGR